MIAVHGGKKADRTPGAIAEPITLSITFERDPHGGYSRGYFYSSKVFLIAL
jgi:cystathionine gamma-synthase